MEASASPPIQASTDWSTRKSLFSESWRAERPRLVNIAVAKESAETHICQQCWSNSAVIRCRDCRPRPFFCAACDASMHTRHPLHNRDASTAGYFQPLPPTTFVSNEVLCPCGMFWFVSTNTVCFLVVLIEHIMIKMLLSSRYM